MFELATVRRILVIFSSQRTILQLKSSPGFSILYYCSFFLHRPKSFLLVDIQTPTPGSLRDFKGFAAVLGRSLSSASIASAYLLYEVAFVRLPGHALRRDLDLYNLISNDRAKKEVQFYTSISHANADMGQTASQHTIHDSIPTRSKTFEIRNQTKFQELIYSIALSKPADINAFDVWLQDVTSSSTNNSAAGRIDRDVQAFA
ncbi:hypothetical protein WAI453_006938 [Rhynchosporium graminicola]